MARRDDEKRRLDEARVLAGMLADRMMAAYVVGGRPSEDQIRALCTAVLLLEEHAVPLPAFAEDVIARLTTADEAVDAPVTPVPVRRRPGMLSRALRPLRERMAA